MQILTTQQLTQIANKSLWVKQKVFEKQKVTRKENKSHRVKQKEPKRQNKSHGVKQKE
jgi:hypothetical protein